MYGVIAVFVVLALIGTARSLIVVPAGMAYVVERLGRYLQTLDPGIHVVLPLIDRIAFRFSLQPTETELSETAVTLDNVPLTLTSRIRAQIVDAQRAAYATADHAAHIAAAVKSAQRHWISARNENDVRQNTRELEAEVAKAAAETLAEAGVKLEDVSVLRIDRAG